MATKNKYYGIKLDHGYEVGIFDNYGAAKVCCDGYSFHDTKTGKQRNGFCKGFKTLQEARDYIGDPNAEAKSSPSSMNLRAQMMAERQEYKRSKVMARVSYNLTDPFDHVIKKNEIIMDNNGKGHLALISFNELSAMDKNFDWFFDLRLFATRYTMNVDLSKYNLIHTPALSPSSNLFNATKVWKNDVFTHDEGDLLYNLCHQEGYNNKTPDWWTLYSYYFVNEMNVIPEAITNLKALGDRLDQGKNVLLMCFCGDWKQCHRSLVGMMMLQRGYTVHFTMESFYEYVEEYFFEQPEEEEEEPDNDPRAVRDRNMPF